ncbi:MAG: diguanylate cyclase response regulator, partial [Pseudomonadota bacterium]|nr:diguanylate cyclase response regulator [Pseudomonadota bacterium]
KVQRLPLNIAVHTPSSLGNSAPGQVGKVLDEYMKNARNAGADAVVSDGDDACQQADPRPLLTVEQALALLQSGKEHVVVNALPDLKRQLMPLLQLMRRVSAGQETV